VLVLRPEVGLLVATHEVSPYISALPAFLAALLLPSALRAKFPSTGATRPNFASPALSTFHASLTLQNASPSLKPGIVQVP